MSNVAHLKPVPKGYNGQTVEILEEVLERAKRGEIIEVMICAKCECGEYLNTWTGSDNTVEMVGVLERMKLLTLRRMDTD